MKVLKMSEIVPDPNQPRKYFNAEKIKTLKESIKKYGVMTPIDVMEVSKDKYLLMDGERRFRSATELKLKEIPAIISAPIGVTERLVRQFNMQEQHEAWTPVEKAVAITNISKEMKLPTSAVVKLLGLSTQDGQRYGAFAELLTKEAWVRNEIPLDYAMAVRGIVIQARHLTEKVLEKDFTNDDVKKIETKIIKLIKKGVITKRSEAARLKDAFKKDPKSIQHFIKDEDATPVSLFNSTKAKGAYHLRNVIQSSRWIIGHTAKYLETKDVKPSHEEIAYLKRAIRDLNLVIAQG